MGAPGWRAGVGRRFRRAAALVGVAAAAAGTPAAAQEAPLAPAGATMTLFDGRGLEGWEHVGPGRFVVEPDGTLAAEGGMGLLFHSAHRFRDFVLELEYRTAARTDNSGVFVRFPTRPTDPWDAVHAGYEIQIDDSQPPLQQTGAIYTFAAPTRLASREPGEWNHFRIEVVGQRFRVHHNGEQVVDWTGDRGREGYIGLQNHGARVLFRNIRVTTLPER